MNPLLLALAAPLVASPSDADALSAQDHADAQLRKPLAIRELLTEPLVDEPGDGRIWVRGRDYRASFGAEGATVLPVFGRECPREFPVALRLAAVTAGADAVTLAPDVSPTVQRHAVTYDHGALREVHHLTLDGIEQTFELDAPLGSGDLVLDVAVETDLEVETDADGGLRFVHPEFGSVHYGDAWLVDATGARTSVPRAWTGDGIELRVPADLLADAVWPIVVDPFIQSFTNGFGVDDDLSPDLCFVSTSRFFVAWEEFTTTSNRDLYVTSFDVLGGQGPSFAIDLTNRSWRTPSLAYHSESDRLLVVSATFESAVARAQGRIVSATQNATVTAQFTIAGSSSFPAREPVVGGDLYGGSLSRFCVAYTEGQPANGTYIAVRFIDEFGAQGGPTNFTPPAGKSFHGPAISRNTGEPGAHANGWWTLAWLESNEPFDAGIVKARRIRRDGSTSSGPGTVTVNSTFGSNAVAVSSTMRALPSSPTVVPSVIAMEAAILNSPDGAILLQAFDGTAGGANQFLDRLEDRDQVYHRKLGGVTTDGRRSFMLSYAEQQTPGSLDHDQYMAVGGLTERQSNLRVTLSERHERISTGGSISTPGTIGAPFDGQASPASSLGAAVWISGQSFAGSLDGAIVARTPQVSTTNWAVGQQYCDAHPNSVGTAAGDDTASWLWIRGDQSVGTTHRAFGVDLPPNVFGYLLTSRTPGSVDMPGGSRGRLCLGGSVGRFNGSVLSSGAFGTFQFDFDPMALPQPMGTTAVIPGQTWFFQYWHRDTHLGVATSNFTNACLFEFHN